MAENNDMLTGFLAGQSDNNSGGFGGFGEGLWAVIILAMIFGGGGFGFGGGFGGGGAAMLNGIATRADINEGFALQNITGGIQGIQQGICDSTYALTNAINGGFNSTQMGMMQGFNGVERGFCDISHQLSDCCCENRMAIQQLRYDMATQACDTRNLIQNTTRDLMENENRNTRSILDFLVSEKLESKNAQIAQLQNQIGRLDQTNVFQAMLDAKTAEIIRRTGHDYPSAAYLVQPPTPVNFPTNGCGTVQFGGYYGNYGGCGCGC